MSFIIFTMNSCSKDNVSISDSPISAPDLKALNAKERVDYFNSVIYNSELENRDETTYTAEETVLGVETLLNYEYDLENFMVFRDFDYIDTSVIFVGSTEIYFEYYTLAKLNSN